MNLDPLAKKLGISESQLKGLRRKYRMEHGDQADVRLMGWLEATWEEKRDRVRRLGKSGGYSEFWSGSMGASERHLKGNLHHEGEGIPDALQAEYSRSSWDTYELVKGEELAKRQARSRSERLRQAEIELRQKGKSPDEYIKVIDEAVDAMRNEAKAA